MERSYSTSEAAKLSGLTVRQPAGMKPAAQLAYEALRSAMRAPYDWERDVSPEGKAAWTAVGAALTNVVRKIVPRGVLDDAVYMIGIAESKLMFSHDRFDRDKAIKATQAKASLCELRDYLYGERGA